VTGRSVTDGDQGSSERTTGSHGKDYDTR
jgi:hypothetical protein